MTNPFKPGSGLFPPYFAGRERELDVFRRKLEQTMGGSPMHMAVVGEWAMGKTSLLKKIKHEAEQRNCFVSGIVSPITDSVAVFIKTIISTIEDDLKRKSGARFHKKLREKLRNVDGVGISAFGFGASIQRSGNDTVSPQFEFRMGLRALWESISEEHEAVVLLVDDLDTATASEKIMKEIMLTIRNSLMEAISHGVKVSCVVTGTKLFDQFETIHGPLIRFFEPFELDRLDDESAWHAITEPLEGTGVIFEDEVVDKILEVTNCHPYYLQEFSYMMYDNRIDNRVNLEVFETSYPMLLHDLAGKIWRRQILELGDASKKILHIIAQGYSSSDEIIKIAKDRYNLKSNNVRVTITRLQLGGHIHRLERGKYALSDSLFGEYIITVFK